MLDPDQAPFVGAERAPDTERLSALARRYVWWTPPERVVADDLDYLVAQVMDMGTWADVAVLHDLVGGARLAAVYQSVQGGRMSARSRAFWSLRLDLPPTPPAKRAIPGAGDV